MLNEENSFWNFNFLRFLNDYVWSLVSQELFEAHLVFFHLLPFVCFVLLFLPHAPLFISLFSVVSLLWLSMFLDL